MRLDTWIAINNINRRQMAKDLGIGYEWLNRITARSRTPSVKLTMQIVHYTKGAVTYEDLLGALVHTPAYRWMAEEDARHLAN